MKAWERCFTGTAHEWASTTTQFTRIKRWNITNNNIVPVDQAGREQLLGNAISRVLWGNNMTNIGPATFHLTGNCVRQWIRCCHEHKRCHYPLHTHQKSQCLRSAALTSARSELEADVVQLLPGVPESRDKRRGIEQAVSAELDCDSVHSCLSTVVLP